MRTDEPYGEPMDWPKALGLILAAPFLMPVMLVILAGAAAVLAWAVSAL